MKKKELKISDISTKITTQSFNMVNKYAGGIYTPADNPHNLLGSYLRNVYTWSTKRYDIMNFKKGIYSSLVNLKTGFGHLDFFMLFGGSGVGGTVVINDEGKEAFRQYVIRLNTILTRIGNNISSTAFQKNIESDTFELTTTKDTNSINVNNILDKMYSFYRSNSYPFNNNYIDSLFKIINTGFEDVDQDSLYLGFDKFLRLDKEVNSNIIEELNGLSKYLGNSKKDWVKLGFGKLIPQNVYNYSKGNYGGYEYIDVLFTNWTGSRSKLKNGLTVFANTVATLSYLISYLTYAWETKFGEKLIQLEVLKEPAGPVVVDTKPKPVGGVVAPDYTSLKKSTPSSISFKGILGGDTGKGNLRRGMKSQEVANMQVSIFVALLTISTPDKIEKYLQDTNTTIDERFIKIIRDSYKLMSNADNFTLNEPVEGIPVKLNDGIFGFRTELLLKLYKVFVLASQTLPAEVKNVSTGSSALQFSDLERRSAGYILVSVLPKTKTPGITPSTIITPNLNIRKGGLTYPEQEETGVGGTEVVDAQPTIPDDLA
jgi:hypothetical protein